MKIALALWAWVQDNLIGPFVAALFTAHLIEDDDEESPPEINP